MLREFPFLTTGDEPLVDRERVEEIRVSRVDRDLLWVGAYREEIKMAHADVNESQRIFFLNRDGQILTEVRQGMHIKSTIGPRTKKFSAGETVGDALLRVSPEDVVFIVVQQIGQRIERNHSIGGYSVTIYKPPRRFTLAEWVARRRLLADLKQ